MNTYVELFSISLDIISALATIIHIYIISLLKKAEQEQNVFLVTLYYANVLDILMSVIAIAGHLCQIREFVLQHFAAALVVTHIAFCMVLLRYIALLFCIVDRWLLLSRPFFYISSLFVKRYPIWLALATVCTIALLGMHAGISHSTQCFDAGLGYLFCSGDYLLFCLPLMVPYIGAALLITIFSLLFFSEYRRYLRQTQTEATGQQRAATNYVCLSAILYFVYTLILTIVGSTSLLMQTSSIKPLMIIINVVYSVLNNLAFLKTTKPYRLKMKEVFRVQMCCHPCNITVSLADNPS